jgi:thiamine pyrophosphokinase
MFQALIILIQSLFATGGNADVTSQAIRQQLEGANYQEATVTYNQTDNKVTVLTPNGDIIVIDPDENN